MKYTCNKKHKIHHIYFHSQPVTMEEDDSRVTYVKWIQNTYAMCDMKSTCYLNPEILNVYFVYFHRESVTMEEDDSWVTRKMKYKVRGVVGLLIKQMYDYVMLYIYVMMYNTIFFLVTSVVTSLVRVHMCI